MISSFHLDSSKQLRTRQVSLVSPERQRLLPVQGPWLGVSEGQSAGGIADDGLSWLRPEIAAGGERPSEWLETPCDNS